MTKIESLEKDLKQTKHTMGNAIMKLVKKVKKMEKFVKSRRVFLRPQTRKSSGETDISPQGLEPAETLAEALSQIKTKRRNVKTRVRRRLDAEDVSTGFEDVSIVVSQILSLLVKKLVSVGTSEMRQKKQREELKRHDELAAKRLQEELELSEAQKKRMAQVQEAAQFYTEEIGNNVWLIRSQCISSLRDCRRRCSLRADYAQRMRIKKLTYEELKEKFEYLMRSMERFVPMDTKKESRKRTGVELQTKSSKKLKSDTREDVFVPKEKDKESKKPESAKSGTEEDVKAYMEERVDEPSSEEFPMSSIP
ncbi:hypothetical protein Tco_0800196 [Tanacetum coccineum]|uniref:Pinin/SDK/MemA protein domain-containing protein n=1 Tax=Tanacetum coccineum TaxID=301880 RepID=A0ABQ4ZWM5_9ASTR